MGRLDGKIQRWLPELRAAWEQSMSVSFSLTALG